MEVRVDICWVPRTWIGLALEDFTAGFQEGRSKASWTFSFSRDLEGISGW